MKISYAVSNIMTKEIVTVKQDSSVKQAIERMVEKNIGSVVVTERGKMVGILTERDVLKKLRFDSECADKKVSELMSSPLIKIDDKAAIGKAADLMAEKGIRRLLVTKDDKIVGIITERDVMRATLDVFKSLSKSWV